MPAKVWKHEWRCAKSEALIEDTVQKSQMPEWGTCAQLVIAALRKHKSDHAPLALHFVALSATEILSERHDISRLCLVSAMSIADPHCPPLEQRLFQVVFGKEAAKIKFLVHNFLQGGNPKEN